jgi:TolB protein
MTRLSRFDRLILLILFSLAGLTAGLVWRGDHVGIQVVSLSPADGATNVSTRPSLRVTFSQPIAEPDDLTLTITPPISGTTRWQGDTLIFQPAALLQSDITYQVTIPAGLTGQRGRTLLHPITWQFQTGRPRVIYLGWNEQDRNQLFVTPITGGDPIALTPPETDILDYGVSRDGMTVAYSIFREDGGSDLWSVPAAGGQPTLLLDCPGAACSGPVWPPVGGRLVYERRNLPGPGGAPGAPRLWWLDTATSQTGPLFEDSQWLGRAASFSAGGQWLAYVAPLAQEVQAYNLENGQTFTQRSYTGERPAWNPIADRFLFTDVFASEQSYDIRLFQVDVTTGLTVSLSGPQAGINDSAAAWSPDGQWIALERKIAQETRGKQLWLMRANGSDARPLTTDADINYAMPAWSPDGRYLAFQRYPLTEAWADPAIWLYDTVTGEMRQLAPAGLQPTWLP